MMQTSSVNGSLDGMLNSVLMTLVKIFVSPCGASEERRDVKPSFYQQQKEPLVAMESGVEAESVWSLDRMDRPRSMAAGPRGHTGQTAVVPVGVGSLPGRGSAINHYHNMEAVPVKGKQRSERCATLSHVLKENKTFTRSSVTHTTKNHSEAGCLTGGLTISFIKHKNPAYYIAWQRPVVTYSL